MSFTSYAQNFEDVLLWRALGHVKNGFYIDVGANDPQQHSVTKAFYERGWYGINIEPLAQYHQAFLQQRPRDINLFVAAGAEDGEITLFDVPSVPGWASADPDVASAHEKAGFEVVGHTVPLKTLRSICAEHVSYDIHFLKIDVEGHEGQVLRGMDFVRWRPWILVIEATMPNSRETNHATWEALVTGHDYQFAYFDGLNRYYVALEHSELLVSLQVQANVFDDFISAHLAKAWKDGEAARTLAQANDERAYTANALRAEATKRTDAAVAQAMDSMLKLLDSEARRQLSEDAQRLAEAGRHAAEAQAANLGADLRAAADSAQALSAWANALNGQLAAIHGSLAWRASKPLRVLGRLVLRFSRSGKSVRHAAASLSALPARAGRKALRAAVASAPVRKYVLPRLLRVPAFEQRMQRIAVALRQQPQAASSDAPPLPPELIDLAPGARKALADLERARRRSLHS